MRSLCSGRRISTGARSKGCGRSASAPELLVDELIAAFEARYAVTRELVETAVERVEFKVPRALREPA